MSARADLGETPAVVTSALTGEGLDELLELIVQSIREELQAYVVRLAPSDGAARAWLHEHGSVLEETFLADGDVQLRVGLSDKYRGRFQHSFEAIELRPQT